MILNQNILVKLNIEINTTKINMKEIITKKHPKLELSRK